LVAAVDIFLSGMTIDNVIATRGRVVVANLYDCSADLHSGPGISRGSTYDCYREIARALRLDGAAVAA
jgi:phytoene dehydrogenase-like protein